MKNNSKIVRIIFDIGKWLWKSDLDPLSWFVLKPVKAKSKKDSSKSSRTDFCHFQRANLKNIGCYLFLVGPQNSIGFQVNIYVGIYGVMSEIVFGQQWKFHLHGSLLKYFQLVLINFNTDCGDVSSWKKDFELIFGAIFGTVFKEFPTCLDQVTH